MRLRLSWLVPAAFVALVVVLVTGRPMLTVAQSPTSLDNETMLSLILPPLPDGSRPGVHMWARGDQVDGPGGLPTVFVVTLLTMQGANGSEEHEVVNYVQYSNGRWAAARPRDSGTLLTDDWSWISLNLTNLTAAVSGQGDASHYTVDYDSMGSYAGSPRELQVEEAYGADLALTSSVILDDTQSPGTTTRPGAAAATATPTARSAATATGGAAAPSGSAAGAGGTTTATPSIGNGGSGSGANTIRPASPTP